LYEAWKQLGWKPSQFDQLLITAGFNVPRRTLNHWISAKPEPAMCSISSRKRGRQSLIDDTGSMVVVGHCISKIQKGESVHLQTVQEFCRDMLGVEISRTTALSIFTEQGFSSRIAKVSSSGINLDTAKLSKICSDWINKQRASGMLSDKPFLFGSMDFTFTKHTTTRPTTYTIKGG